MDNKIERRIEIELPSDKAEGTYSNFFLVSHSPSEFVIDFSRLLPGLQKAKVYARIILTPQHAKQLLEVLKENISKYESKFGEIKLHPKEKRIGFTGSEEAH